MHKKADTTGAVTEDDFEIAFGNTPEVEVTTHKELKDKITLIHTELEKEDWERRVEALKTLRGVVKSRFIVKEELLVSIKSLDLSLQSAVKDLRSQIVREACITISYLTTEFKTKLELFLDTFIENLMNLVPNGTKIMSSSGKVALKYIVNYTQSAKLLSYFLKCLLEAKSTMIRQFSSELIKICCSKWSTRPLEKHIAVIAEAIKKGISDADEQTRSHSRDAFCWYNSKFPQQAQNLLKSLDTSKQKALKRELDNFSGAAGGDTVDSSSASKTQTKKLFKVPNSTIGRPATTTGGTASKNYSYATSNSSTNRSRVNSTRSEANSANNSTEYLYVKPQVSASNSSNYGWRSNTHNSHSGRQRIPQARTNTTNSTIRKVGKVSQSQPATREHSPSGKSSVSTCTNGSDSGSHGTRQHATGNTSSFQRTGNRNQPGFSSLRQKNLAAAVTEGLRSNKQSSHTGYDYYQSDDNMSETSSVVSDQQLVSFHSLEEFFSLLSSKIWSDRKKGLSHLEHYIMEMELRPNERKMIIDTFNTMFLENQSAVVKKFLTVLRTFIDRCYEHLDDWIYTLLIKLMHVHANDKLRSSKLTVASILKLLLERCGARPVFSSCCKFIVDKNHDPTIKVKLSLLEYMKTILTLAPPNILEPNQKNNAELSPMLCTILLWTTESKSTDLRKMASNIVVKMFDLNSAEFTKILSSVPSTFQDRATNLLNAYVSTNLEKDKSHESDELNSKHNYSNTSASSSKNSTPLHKASSKQSSNNTVPLNSENISEFLRNNTEAMNNLSINYQDFDKVSSVSAGNNQNQPSQTYNTNSLGNRSAANFNKASPVGFGNTNNKSRLAQPTVPPSKSPYSYLSPTQKAPTDSNTTPNRQTSLPEPSPYQFNLNSTQRQPITSPLYNNNINSSNILLQQHPSNEGSMDSSGGGGFYNPDFYNSGPIDTRNIPQSNSKLPPEDVVSEILKELCNYNDRHEERKACLFKLIKMFRDNAIRHTDWDEHFKTLLFVLLETMADNNTDIRAQSLRVLQELAKNQASRFSEFSQLTVLRVLEAHRDTDKNVIKAAEECSRTLTNTLAKDICLKILISAIANDEEEEELEDEDGPVNGAQNGSNNAESASKTNQLCLPALKMLAKLIKSNSNDRNLFGSEVDNLCNALSKAINHPESAVRKETILCLVEVYSIIREDIWKLVVLTTSQRRLLDVYIKKSTVA